MGFRFVATLGLIGALCGWVLPPNLIAADAERAAETRPSVMGTGTRYSVDRGGRAVSTGAVRWVVLRGSGAGAADERGPLGAGDAAAAAAVDVLTALHGRDGLTAVLKAQGVALNRAGWGRADGEVCYVIGAGADDPDVPQLWLTRDRLLPARLVVREGDRVHRVDFVYGPGSGFVPGMPEELRFSTDGRLRAVHRIDRVTENPPGGRELFDAPARP